MRDSWLVADPRTRYARGEDVSIAYQVLGDGPLDLVIVPGFVSHLEIQWQSRPHRRFVERLAETARVIRYDKRGTGLSDPVASAPTLEQRVADLRAVLDAVDCARALLLGYSDGGPTAIAFAVDAPERTARLVLYGTSARPPPLWFRDRFRELLADWGQGASLDVFAPSLASESSDLEREAAGAFERAGASPAMARALLEALVRTDVRRLLPRVSVPTLVIHRDRDVIPVDEARYLARRISGARYLELSGVDHQPWIGDSEAVVRAIEEFAGDALLSLPIEAANRRQAGPGDEAVAQVASGDSPWETLTSAERVVAMLVAEGLSNPQIAGRLFISRHTVEAHLKHIFLKLDLGSRVELARIAVRDGGEDP